MASPLQVSTGSTTTHGTEHRRSQANKELEISTESFTPKELQLAKEKITEGKAYGEDGISPEVIKRCDFDEIILGVIRHMGLPLNSGG